MMFTECQSGCCPCGDLCENQRFQKHQWIKGLKKFQTSTERGCGVKTEQEILKGTFICEYVGEVVSGERFSERMHTVYNHCVHHYALHLSSGFLIDSYRCGSVARFVNHSCLPNCEIQKWFVNGFYRVGLFALRDIDAGEELTYDYKFHAFRSQQKCLCGSSNCRGTIGSVSGNGNGFGVPASIPTRKPDIMRPVSQRQRSLVSEKQIFLLRNINRVRRRIVDKGLACPGPADEKPKLDVKEFILALKNSRTLRTRRFSSASENQTFLRVAQLGIIHKLRDT